LDAGKRLLLTERIFAYGCYGIDVSRVSNFLRYNYLGRINTRLYRADAFFRDVVANALVVIDGSRQRDLGFRFCCLWQRLDILKFAPTIFCGAIRVHGFIGDIERRGGVD
jgi:hypothetical protein